MDRFIEFSRFSRVSCRLGMAMLIIFVAGCASNGAQERIEAEEAAYEAQQLAEAEAAQIYAARESVRIEQERMAEQQRQAQLAQQAQEREREELLARAQAEREEAVARERQQAQRREAEQLARISALEAEIAAAMANTQRLSAANERLEMAVEAAQELLEALTTEQSKYANTDSSGELRQPLNKEGIAELETRKDTLKSEAQALAQP